MDLFQFRTLCFCLVLVLQTCVAINQNIGQIYPGFKASQMNWVEDHGLFLLSNNSIFAFGFGASQDVTMFALEVIHINSSQVVWTANIGLLVSRSDNFVFDNNGNVYLESGNGVVWSTNTTGETAAAMELQDSGNLILLGDNGRILWQSFSHPTDTLLLGQEFLEGMQLKSVPNRNNLSQYLEIKSGDLVLYARYETPQIYWSIADDSRKTRNNISGKVHSASLVSNSWNFYDQKAVLLWQFIISSHFEWNATWAAVLGSDGSISFYNLQMGKSATPEAIRIPESFCSIPEPCDPYYVCYMDNKCRCPSFLNSQFSCKPKLFSNCNSSTSSVDLFYVGENLDYFALGFVTPILKSNLYACKQACLRNCSCLVLFFENSSGSCFLFDQIGSLQHAEVGSAGYISYVKVLSNGDGGRSPARESRNGRHILVILIIVTVTFLVIVGLIFGAFSYHGKNKILLETSQDTSEDDSLLDSLSGMPVRFSYSDLHRATNNFSIKLGKGGFCSVYLGVVPDGTLLAVKQLEGTGQGMKEFRSEISLIGSIHHVHLVQLKGFCAEGPHRLLVYEYMGKGSLDRWIFKNKILLETSQDTSEDDSLLDSLSGMPVRFSYSDLHRATNNFSIKLGKGGFCSVYLGVVPDGTLLAVKQLEGTGQGMKEFRSEISLIGSIHHVHLVQLKGFCAEGPHRLLVYEYMGKGSLDRWIFKNKEDGPMLDWDTRFNIAVGTAKGLAYLHEECEVKILHCDIKPENVLLDDNYVAKVSDFGLAKLMDREQSLVCTQLRGTRGYLAPEWIFDHAISEKSDVYSYGMLLLEIIGGRKNSDSRQCLEKAYLPSYAFRMMEEEKVKEILDSKLENDEKDERVVTAIKVALWCIQEDMQLRPPMTKVVQMLEGHCAVPQPPSSSKLGSHSSFSKWGSEASTSTSRMIDYDSVARLSGVRLSGPR